MTGQNRHRAINLFGSENARQLMRQSHRAEGEDRGRPCAHALIEPFGPADGEPERLAALISFVCNELRKGGTRRRLAAFVERRNVAIVVA